MFLIGRRDIIDLPEWNLEAIEAKVDTGAYGCAIHCHKIELIEDGGIVKLQFELLDPQHPDYIGKKYTVTTFREKKVKSSSGVMEKRFVVKTELKIFNEIHVVEFSLTNRKKMKYPVLLGRKFLKKRFLVDVSKKNLSQEGDFIKV